MDVKSVTEAAEERKGDMVIFHLNGISMCGLRVDGGGGVQQHVPRKSQMNFV